MIKLIIFFYQRRKKIIKTFYQISLEKKFFILKALTGQIKTMHLKVILDVVIDIS